MKICVMLGGASPERSVSIESGKAVASALEKLGHEVLLMDPALNYEIRYTVKDVIGSNNITGQDFKALQQGSEKYLPDYINWLRRKNADIVFNAMHGGRGENGVIAAHLELAGIPFTGSGFAASAFAMDKYRSKSLFRGAGIPTADFEIIEMPVHKPESINFPLVIKPSCAGSSVGLFVLKEKQSIFDATTHALKYDSKVLIEEFIDGIELTVPIVGGKVYPVVEIEPEGGVYDYTRKYTSGKSSYYVPARIPRKASDEVQGLALKVWDLLGLENYARIDFRMDKKGGFHCLEANTLPGMTSTSLLPKSLAYSGVDFPDLLELIIEDALKLRS